MDNKFQKINIIFNIIYIFISAFIIFLSWLLKVDYFIYQEHDPVFFRLTDKEEIIEYFRRQEFNYLLILSGFILLYLVINSIFCMIKKIALLIKRLKK